MSMSILFTKKSSRPVQAARSRVGFFNGSLANSNRIVGDEASADEIGRRQPARIAAIRQADDLATPQLRVLAPREPADLGRERGGLEIEL